MNNLEQPQQETPVDIYTARKQKMAAQLKEWSAQIHLMEAKMENLGADINVKRTDEMAALRTTLHAASEKMAELEHSTGAAWDAALGTAEKIWEDLKSGVATAQAKFK